MTPTSAKTFDEERHRLLDIFTNGMPVVQTRKIRGKWHSLTSAHAPPVHQRVFITLEPISLELLSIPVALDVKELGYQ